MNKLEIKHPARQDTSNAPYSAGIVCDGWLYVSGQGPIDIASGQIVGATIEEQTRLTLQNVMTVLQEAGCTSADVVKCTCYLLDIADFDAFSRTYMEFFSGVRPARTTVQAALWNGIKVEIDAVARLPHSTSTQPES
jgi:2-iminobutanoate/2-iminopropanoate deaminase